MNTKLKVLIGGSASTGSSLLAHILGQHSQIYCGLETNLFTQPDWILNWPSIKLNINKTTLKDVMSKGWHIHKGVQISDLLGDRDFEHLVRQSIDYQSFIYELYLYVNVQSGKEFIAEKTPSNALCFHLLRSKFDQTQFVLTIRNPIDAILSMQKRGWSLIYSCGVYLLNIAMGYDPDYDVRVIKYEDLSRDPEGTILPILHERNFSFESQMTQNLEKMTMLSSWRPEKPNEVNSDVTIPNFRKREIEYLIDHLCFKKDFEFYGKKPVFKNIRAIMNHFKYFMVKSEERSQEKVKALSFVTIEYAKRTFRKYPLSGNSFPFIIE
tara:strand:- start:149 stop:1120 length:972 start_codon:yes stop_codon:yes gene_type:complete